GNCHPVFLPNIASSMAGIGAEMGILDGRVALVTGALRGIGAATAKALADEGALVIVTDRDDPHHFAETLGGLAFQFDVTDEVAWAQAMAFARDAAGGLDILVNNAGFFQMKPLIETTRDEWRRMQIVNVESMFLGAKHA